MGAIALIGGHSPLILGLELNPYSGLQATGLARSDIVLATI